MKVKKKEKNNTFLHTQLNKYTHTLQQLHANTSICSLSHLHYLHLNWLSMRVPFILAFLASSSACVKRNSTQITYKKTVMRTHTHLWHCDIIKHPHILIQVSLWYNILELVIFSFVVLKMVNSNITIHILNMFTPNIFREEYLCCNFTQNRVMHHGTLNSHM